MADYDPYAPNGYDEGAGEETEGNDIVVEDCWKVISSFFESKGLVSMQIESFNEFMKTNIQDLVAEKDNVTIDRAIPYDESESNPIVLKRFEVKYGGILLGAPSTTEADGSINHIMPHEARLRSLTYAAPVYCKMKKYTFVAREHRYDEYSSCYPSSDGTELWWNAAEEEGDGEEADVFIGRVPLMVKSSTCHLLNTNIFKSETDLFAWGECPFDQGGYFIINGSEKVLIAQERSAGNIVQVFQKSGPSPFTYLAEIRSVVDRGQRQMSQCTVKLMRRGEGAEGSRIDNPIHVQLPYCKNDIGRCQ
jgi:DNA-directed RNA polymerase II subunit RPB2